MIFNNYHSPENFNSNYKRSHYTRIEEYYISRCLELALQGRGSVSPNPMVGAVVLDINAKKVGEGYHARAGGPHAEIAALEQAGDKAHGGTLFVNLEPCNHYGKTPPCTEAIIKAEVSRVVCGTLDPNPLVSGSGRDRLQNARISVRHGFLENDCQKLNEIFFHHILTKRPFVILKVALTLDGKIATRSGESQWLTGDFSRHFVHYLRSGYDAILTTGETVAADNPQLTTRNIPNARQPVRVILDRQFRLNPEDFQIFNTKQSPTWVVVSKHGYNQENAQRARKKGVDILEADETGLGLDLKNVLEILGEKGVTSVFVEAGGKLAGQLMNQDLINKLYLFYGAKVLPDPSAKNAFCDGINLRLSDSSHFSLGYVRRLENDIVIEAYPHLKHDWVKEALLEAKKEAQRVVNV